MTKTVLLFPILILWIWFIISTAYNMDTENKIQQSYKSWYDKWYDEWMCNIARTVTGYKKCEVKEIQIGTGKTTKITISLPD